jgi:branched-chain amino acid transport system ATP-binding protein
LHESSIILLDEPSLGLDPKTQNKIFEIIKEINKEGITIIIVKQNAKKAAEISDQICVLENGKLVIQVDKSILKDKRSVLWRKVNINFLQVSIILKMLRVLKILYSCLSL